MAVVAPCDGYFFEGAEKLLEIWFQENKISSKSGDARSVPREKWEEMLDKVQCKVLKVMKHENQIAYILSESSMFISKRRVILKTCGTTLCLEAFPYIRELVREHSGMDTIADVFYSRKNFMEPSKQPHVHTTFQNEVEYLNTHLRENGAAYCLGNLSSDCWHLFTLNHAANNRHIGVQQPDQTIEILMTDLNQEEMKKYNFLDGNGNEKRVDTFTKDMGIDCLIPNSKIHSVLFEPCGYSMNGLSDNDTYWTIHVTPEPEYSYASFETNASQADYGDLIERVVKVFKPGKFTMTLFIDKNSISKLNSWPGINCNELLVSGYQCQELQTARLQEYSLIFANYAVYN